MIGIRNLKIQKQNSLSTLITHRDATLIEIDSLRIQRVSLIDVLASLSSWLYSIIKEIKKNQELADQYIVYNPVEVKALKGIFL